ncbi:Transcription factor [Hyphodiscus hymeniophilus]|uniref:Transcription factor n=1 Tax=Hyphodiscus hymeniophilus TaxID=353542 RepID=A0A9P7AZA6_9HELO|nr:Transcription factor [Hyphodiscus hymeniophilus]
MSESVPTPRKRRRPALSCVECRRRKIKCDRNDPCTQCTQSKSASCTYKDGYPGYTNGHAAKAKSPVTFFGPAQHNVPFVSDSINLDRAQAHGSTPRTVPLFVDSHSNSTTLYSPSPDDPPPEHDVQILSDRVSKLEKNLNTISPRNLDPSWTSFSTKNSQDFFGQASKVPVPGLRGAVSKTRLFGQSHWMSSFEHFKKISNFRNGDYIDTNPMRHAIKTSEIKTLLEKCKTMARAAKAERPNMWHVDASYRDSVPSRELSDKLVHLYLRNFESTHRILHIPTFEKEYEDYWKDPQNAAVGFLIKLLLVAAIGTVFYQEADFHYVRSLAQQWVYAAQSWISEPFEKGRLNLSGLQVHCLILIARQTTGVGGDLVWISVGSLVRMAITMGFHRDPRLFPRMTVLHAELRRRLWATVLEMAVMSSFDSGNPALISPSDWDTDPPSNINDSEINETTTEAPVSKPCEVYTQASLQIQLLKSLHTRLEISKLITDFRFQPAYDDILRLGTEMQSHGRSSLLLAQSIPPDSLKPNNFQRNLLDTPIRRVLLALHFPFAIKARLDPRFYFSRKVSLDAAITILTYPCTSSPSSPHSLDGEQDDYTRLKLVGAGYFKELLIYACIIVQLELITQLEEESPMMRNELERHSREPLKAYIAYMIELTKRRVSLGENNIKGHLFLSAVSAQIDALEKGEDPDPLIAEAAKRSAEVCYGMLKQRTKKPPSSIVMDEVIARSQDEKESSLYGYGSGNLGGQMEFGTDMDHEFAFEYLMPDANVNFDIPESWLFEGWEEHHEW